MTKYMNIEKTNNGFSNKEVSSIQTKTFTEGKESFRPKELLQKSTDLGISLKKNEVNEIVQKIENISEINENSNYSVDVNKYIKTPTELKVYQNANLTEGIVNDRIVLKSDEINQNLIDSMNRTNIDRMKKGLAPIDENGDSFNLHHIGQKMNSPLAELKQAEHNIYDGILHDKSIKTEIHNGENENTWSVERSRHWKERAKEEYCNV